MPVALPLALLLEANKLVSTRPWLLLLKIILPDTSALYFVRNTDNITYDGQTWVAYPFTVGDVGQSGDGKVQTVQVQVANVNRSLTPYIEDNAGLVGCSVQLIAVHEANLGTPSDYADLTLSYTIMATHLPSDSMWAQFTLGAESPMRRRFPINSAVPMDCVWVPHFKGPECRFNGGTGKNHVASAAVATGGAGNGMTSGNILVQVVGGTGDPCILRVSQTNGALSSILGIVDPGSYSSNPSSPAAITLATGTVTLTFAGSTSNEVASASVVAGGTGGTSGVKEVTGSTGTIVSGAGYFRALVNISGGAITSVLSITYGGSYTTSPTNPAPVTGAGLSGATLSLSMQAETCKGSLLACQNKGNSGRFGGRPGMTSAPKFS